MAISHHRLLLQCLSAARASAYACQVAATVATEARAVLQPRQPQQQQHHGFHSSSASGNTDTGKGSSSSGSGSGGDPASHFDRMFEVMMANPMVMQMMMSRMPPHMQKPEVLKAMMANPEVRARMSALAQEKGLASIIQSIDLDKVSQGMSATQQAGIDPAVLVARFRASPSLAQAMENPRGLAALMDMASNGADALKKYEGDKDVVEAAMEAGTILQQLQQEGGSASQASSSSSSDSSSASSSSMAEAEELLGVSPQQLMQRLMARPDLLAQVQDPEVQAALVEVSQSPWKIVKYTFNKKVLSALKALKDVAQIEKQS